MQRIVLLVVEQTELQGPQRGCKDRRGREELAAAGKRSFYAALSPAALSEKSRLSRRSGEIFAAPTCNHSHSNRQTNEHLQTHRENVVEMWR